MAFNSTASEQAWLPLSLGEVEKPAAAHTLLFWYLIFGILISHHPLGQEEAGFLHLDSWLPTLVSHKLGALCLPILPSSLQQ